MIGRAIDALQSLFENNKISGDVHDEIKGFFDELGAEAAAMRDHLNTILAVVSDEEGDPSGPFTVAREFLADADIGGAELDYRNALEAAARDCLQTFGASQTPEIARLAGVLSQSPALFIQTDRLSLFLERVASITDRFTAKEFASRWRLAPEQKYQLKRIVLNALNEAVNVDAGLDHDLNICWATLTPKWFAESAVTSRRKPARDRLDDLLSDVADDAMDEISSLHKEDSSNPFFDKFQFESSVLEAFRQRVKIHFETEIVGGVRHTTFSVKLKGEG